MLTRWLRRFSWPERQQRRTERFLKRLFDRNCPGNKAITPNYITYCLPGKHGGIIALNGVGKTERVSLWTSLELLRLDDRLSVPLLSLLLRKNPNLSIGSFGLHDTPQGLSIVQTFEQPVDAGTPHEWNGIMQTLLTQCQNLTFQLYAEGYINRVSDRGGDYDEQRGYAGR